MIAALGLTLTLFGFVGVIFVLANSRDIDNQHYHQDEWNSISEDDPEQGL